VKVNRSRIAAVPLLLACLGCGSEAPTSPGSQGRAPFSPPYLVKDILPGAGSGVGGRITDGDGVLFFTANDGAHGEQLWRTDGTGAGTAMVTDFARAWGTGFHWMKPHLYFTADDGVHGTELWRSDGTARGTGLVRDLVPGAGSLILDNFQDARGRLYFFETAQANVSPFRSFRLLESDGTAEGTGVVRDLGSRYARGSNPTRMLAPLTLGGRLFFAWDSEIWRSDGSAAGTLALVEDITVSDPVRFVARDQRLYFTTGTYDVWNGVSGRAGLWTADMESGARTMLKEFRDETQLTRLAAAGASLFFVVDFADLWRSDGTPEGTALLRARSGNTDYVNPRVSLGGALLFNVGSSLWRTDGTAAGTTLVHERVSVRGDVVEIDGRAYFAAEDGVHGIELWSSDGTREGTAIVADLRPGPESSRLGSLVVSGRRLYFPADDGVSGRELWALPLAASKPELAGPTR